MSRQYVNQFDPLEVPESEIYRFLTLRFLAQNQLSWSRLQLMLAIEAAALAGAISKPGAVAFVLLILASFLIFILLRLIRRDWDVRDQDKALLDRVHQPLAIALIVAPIKRSERGSFYIVLIVWSLIIANLILMVFLK